MARIRLRDRLRHCARGATVLEYAFLVCFVAAVMIGAIETLGAGVGGLYNAVRNPFGW